MSTGTPDNRLSVFDKQHVFWLFIAFGALGYFLGHPNPFIELPLCTLLTPFSLFALSSRVQSARTMFRYSWLAGSLGLSAAVYWIYYPVHEVGMLPALLSIPCILLLGAYLGIYTGLTGVAMQQAYCLFAPTGTYTSIWSGTAHALFCGLVFAGFEVLCGTMFTGFPWYNLASAFAWWPAWVQAASITGSYGLTAVFAAGACLMAFAAGCLSPSRVCLAISGCALVAAMPLYGMLRLEKSSVTRPASVTVALVQGNIDQNQKWDSAFLQSTVSTYVSLTKDIVLRHNAEHPDKKIDIAIWPETAMPFLFNRLPELAEQVRQTAAECKIPLVFGTLGEQKTAPGLPMGIFNRLLFLNADGTNAGYYDKQHLVPFGEYIPFTLPIPFLENILQGVDFSRGTQSGAIHVALPPVAARDNSSETPAQTTTRHIALGPLICYEAIFPELAGERVARGATALLTVSNDAWFGHSSAPRQHLGLAVMRSVEQQRPLIRATNTGITAVTDAYGRMETHGQLYTRGAFVVKITAETDITFYQLHGHAIHTLLLATALGSLCIYPVRAKLARQPHQ